MPKSLKYITKITGITEVSLAGKLELELLNSIWNVGDESLEEWLSRFSGHNISVTIRILNHGDFVDAIGKQEELE